MNAKSLQALHQKIASSELGREWIDDPLMNEDKWSIEELGYTKEEARFSSAVNIYFEGFSLPELKLLTKLTVKASAREKASIGVIKKRTLYLKQLEKILLLKGCTKLELITDDLLQEFISEGSEGCKKHRRAVIAYAINLWKEEEWLNLNYTPPQDNIKNIKIETIPEEVLYQIYENFDLFPPPLERLFRLQLVLGWRIGEMMRIPRRCLKQEGEKWYILRWIEKRKQEKYYEIHPLVVELIREQQKFLDAKLGQNSNFDKLFCKVSTTTRDGATNRNRFEVEPIYLPETLSNVVIGTWLRGFSERANLKDKYGKRFNLTSHHFRRTKASIMAYCETEDEYIAVVLGHGSLDMLPHYRERSLKRLEKEASVTGSVDMYGRITVFKPRNRRRQKLDQILTSNSKMTIQSGECHKPTMLGGCELRFACSTCEHNRVKPEDRPMLEADIQALENDLQKAQKEEQQRKITEITRLLEILNNKLRGLDELENIIKRGEEHDES